MPKIDLHLLNTASFEALGGMSYTDTRYRPEQERLKKLAGITKGQWKRFQYDYKHKANYEMPELRASARTEKRLKIMLQYAKNENLETLLKIADAQHDD